MEKLAYGMSILSALYLLLLVLTTKMLVMDIGPGRSWGKTLKKKIERFLRGKGNHGNDTILE